MVKGFTKNILWSAMMSGTFYPTYGLEYGNLEDLHPSESFSEIKARRESNFTILKTILEGGARYAMPPRRLEVSIPAGQKINSSSLQIAGANKNTSQIIVYPFVPRTGVTSGIFMEPRYGDVYDISNVTIKSPVKNYLHETYSCILKPGGATNQIQILGTVRDDFWAEMIPGKTIFYGWTFSVLGETKIIQSVNSGTATITLTTNISASVASDTQGATVNFGTSFKEDISEADYLTYGDVWILNNFDSNRLIYSVPASSTGTASIITTNNVVFENTAVQLLLSMGSGTMNLNDTTFRNGSTPLSFFTRNLAGGQTLNSTGTLLVENTGDIVAGAIATLEPSGNYGAGGYLHDNVLVNLQGTLHLKDNLSASWRQYSSSYSPANPGSNYYANILEEGSTEYGFLMSNTMPTVIDNITATGSILMRHDTTINGGDLAYLSNQGTDFGLGSRNVEVNDTILRGVCAFNFFTTGELNNCTYKLPEFSTLQLMVTPSSGTFNITGGTIENSGNVGTWNSSTGAVTGNRGSNFCAYRNVTIDGLTWDSYLYHYLFTTGVTQAPYTEKDFNNEINNTDIVAYSIAVDGLSAAGGVSSTISGTNTILRNSFYSQNAGRGLIQNISGNTGTISKSIVASKAYALIGTVTNVLEIDFEHDYYQTSGTINAILAANPWTNSYSANTCYGRNIRIYAVGGDITLSTFDATLRPTSNIIGTNGTVILNGNYLDLTIDRDYVFQTGTSVVTPTLFTGNGATKIYKGVLADFILDPTVIMNITAGAINVNADANGLFTDANVVGFVDYWTGKYEFRFTANVPNLTTGVLTYNKPNAWKNTGAWII